MNKINLPKDILKKEELSKLPAQGKSEYITNLLKKLIELNPDGVTNAQIREATNYTDSTLWHHLEVLNFTEQCNKIQRGSVDVFYPNKRIGHFDEELRYSGNKAIYCFSITRNKFGKFAYIHKKTESRLGDYVISSGLSIPYDLIDNFISILHKIKEIHLNEDNKG